MIFEIHPKYLLDSSHPNPSIVYFNRHVSKYLLSIILNEKSLFFLSLSKLCSKLKITKKNISPYTKINEYTSEYIYTYLHFSNHIMISKTEINEAIKKMKRDRSIRFMIRNYFSIWISPFIVSMRGENHPNLLIENSKLMFETSSLYALRTNRFPDRMDIYEFEKLSDYLDCSNPDTLLSARKNMFLISAASMDFSYHKKLRNQIKHYQRIQVNRMKYIKNYKIHKTLEFNDRYYRELGIDTESINIVENNIFPYQPSSVNSSDSDESTIL